jgi:putative endonuclease
MMINKRNGTIYTGVTSDLIKRVYEHKNDLRQGFTIQHNYKTLAYYEVFDDMVSAITREKQIKGGSRTDKIKLIERMNPEWKDLYDTIV